jgi:hypothetical protein
VIEFCWLDSIVKIAELLADVFAPEVADFELDELELPPQPASSAAETSTEHVTAAPRCLNALFVVRARTCLLDAVNRFMEVHLPL